MDFSLTVCKVTLLETKVAKMNQIALTGFLEYLNCRKSESQSEFYDQYNILLVFINNTRTAWAINFLVQILNLSDS